MVQLVYLRVQVGTVFETSEVLSRRPKGLSLPDNFRERDDILACDCQRRLFAYHRFSYTLNAASDLANFQPRRSSAAMQRHALFHPNISASIPMSTRQCKTTVMISKPKLSSHFPLVLYITYNRLTSAPASVSYTSGKAAKRLLTQRVAAAQLRLLRVLALQLITDAVEQLHVALLRILLEGSDEGPRHGACCCTCDLCVLSVG